MMEDKKNAAEMLVENLKKDFSGDVSRKVLVYLATIGLNKLLPEEQFHICMDCVDDLINLYTLETSDPCDISEE